MLNDVLEGAPSFAPFAKGGFLRSNATHFSSSCLSLLCELCVLCDLCVKSFDFLFYYRSLPPKNKCAMATSTTAPTVAAANESKKVFSCTIPSFVKIHPPITDPISPSRISPMHPNPRPRPNFPASHPAISPMRIHSQNPWGAWFHTLRRFLSTSFCCIINVAIIANIFTVPPLLSRSRFLLRHAMNRPQPQHQIPAVY